MTNLFTYGSLMFKEVIYALTSQKHYRTSGATLQGYKRSHVKGKVYPGITAAADSQVEGVVYFEVTNEDMQTLNKFENTQYIPTLVDLVSPEGKVRALAYVYADPSNLSEVAWSAEQFQKNHKEEFAQQHLSQQAKSGNDL